MTEGRAGVAATVEQFATDFTAEQGSVAPGQSAQGPARAGLTEGGPAGVTGPRVTEVQAAVRTGRVLRGQSSATDFPTAVRHEALVPVPLRPQHFPAEAPVLPGQRLHHHLTARAPPAGLQSGGLGPLLHTADMEYLRRNFRPLRATGQYFLPGNSCDSPRWPGVV